MSGTPPAPPAACQTCGKPPGEVSFTFLKDRGTYRKLCKGCNNDRVKRTAAERSVEPRQCDTCSIVKPAADFEALRKTCKACRTANRAKASAAALVDKGKQRCDVPLPAACGECGLSAPQVNFKWRSDVHGGTYRNICCTCINKRGYSEDSRKRAMENDPVGYRARQNATHLAWTRANPDKVKAWQEMQATDPERKVKIILSKVRREMGEDTYAICAADKELLKAKLSMPCHYCDRAPGEGEKLNGLDRLVVGGMYTDANTVAACGVCNGMRRVNTIDDFVASVRRIARLDPARLEGMSALPVPQHMSYKRSYERKECSDPSSSQRQQELRDQAELTVDECLAMHASACYLCGRAPALGIDRVDSSLGDVDGNCRACCTVCISLKKHYDLKEFLGHIARVEAHTAHWVLGDTEDRLVVLKPIKPVSATDPSTGATVIFPSTGIAAKITGAGEAGIWNAMSTGAAFRGALWKAASAREYQRQSVPYAAARAMFDRLISYGK